MSLGLKPLIWKNIERSEKDDIWPKKVFGASLVYITETNQYFLIGGNYDTYDNHLRNYELNRELIKSVDANVLNFHKAEQNKINYITDNVTHNYYNAGSIEIYTYELEPEPHWFKNSSKGKAPKQRSFQQCIYMSPFIFLFGGVELGPKSENLSNEDMYVLNTKTFEWKQILCNLTPYNRSEFEWVRIGSRAILYGGASSPSEKFYEDMWMFKHDGTDYFPQDQERKTEFQKNNLWVEIIQKGKTPGMLKAYAMEYHEGYFYLFGGIDNKRKSNNTLYRFDIKNSYWEIVQTKGPTPAERCYHKMSLINNEYLLIFGGIKGSMTQMETMYNDIYLFNILESIWIQPIIGGIQPSPRLGFSHCCNYVQGHMDILILGGVTKDNDGNTDKTKSFLKLFFITENDSTSKFYWTIRDTKYKEEPNDDNFLVQAEKSIYEYKEKIACLELDTRAKELANEEMKKQITEYKKQFYQQHGFIDDQSQTLEDQILEQEDQKNNLYENFEMDKQITDLKIKLKMVMGKKAEKTMEFFNDTCAIFINYYDSLSKIVNNDHTGEMNTIFSLENLEEMKAHYQEKLSNAKTKLEQFGLQEENIAEELNRYQGYEKSCEEVFKKDLEYYKQQEESNANVNANSNSQ